MTPSKPVKKIRLPIVRDDSSSEDIRGQTFGIPSILISLVSHLLVLFMLAYIIFDSNDRLAANHILATFAPGKSVDNNWENLDTNLSLSIDVAQTPAEKRFEKSLVSELANSADVEVPVPSDTVSMTPSDKDDFEDSLTEQILIGDADTSVESDAENGTEGTGTPRITSGRTGAKKLELLQRFGGTAQTEESVRLGLQWLAKQQAKDGSWSFAGPYTDGARFGENSVAATSMALLAFLGAGHTQRDGDYQRQVDKGLRWLIARQSSGGNFGSGTPNHHALYTHAQATIVLCEAYGMTRERWLKPHCKSAVEFAVRSQGPRGGWRYEFRGDSDTSVTGWFVMALVSAKSAGLDVPEKTLKKINGWLDEVSQEYGTLYSYMPRMPATPSMTAEGLLCRMYLGWPRTNPAIDRSVERLVTSAPLQIETQTYYYWYYATQVLHHAGGEAWETWNATLREELPAMQITDGPETGSWSPGGSMFDRMGGRLYATCMAVYCLEVYYRHLPIYDSPWEETVVKP